LPRIGESIEYLFLSWTVVLVPDGDSTELTRRPKLRDFDPSTARAFTRNGGDSPPGYTLEKLIRHAFLSHRQDYEN